VISSNPGTIRQLLNQWQTEAETLQNRFRDERGAFLVSRMARELEEALRAHNDEPLTLAQAAEESGYSEDHIARLIRAGKLPNAGRLHAPRVRRGDLPLKTSHLRDDDTRDHIALTKSQIVRSIANAKQ